MDLVIVVVGIIIYLLIGYGFTTILCNHEEPYVFAYDVGVIGKTIAALLWPFDFGRMLAKCFVFYNMRLQKQVHEDNGTAKEDPILYHVFEIFKLLEKHLPEMADVISLNNPAFGEDNATHIKKQKLFSQYAEYLQHKGLSPEDATMRAQFLVYSM